MAPLLNPNDMPKAKPNFYLFISLKKKQLNPNMNMHVCCFFFNKTFDDANPSRSNFHLTTGYLNNSVEINSCIA